MSNQTIDNRLSKLLKGIRLDFQFPIKDIPEFEQNLLNGISESLTIKRKQYLFKENNKPEGVYFLKSGKIKLLKEYADGRSHIHFIITGEQFFGYRPILSDMNHPLSAVALEDCELTFIPVTKFLQAIELMPVFCRKLLEELCRSFSVLIARTNLYSQKSVPQRLAYAILLLNEKYHNDSKTNVNLSRKDLAAFIGTSIEVLVRTLKQFEKQQLIKLEAKNIIIADLDALIDLAESE